MYKLEIKAHKYGFQYIIYYGPVEIGRGYRVDEREARADGIHDLNMARQFRVAGEEAA